MQNGIDLATVHTTLEMECCNVGILCADTTSSNIESSCIRDIDVQYMFQHLSHI